MRGPVEHGKPQLQTPPANIHKDVRTHKQRTTIIRTHTHTHTHMRMRMHARMQTHTRACTNMRTTDEAEVARSTTDGDQDDAENTSWTTRAKPPGPHQSAWVFAKMMQAVRDHTHTDTSTHNHKHTQTCYPSTPFLHSSKHALTSENKQDSPLPIIATVGQHPMDDD